MDTKYSFESIDLGQHCGITTCSVEETNALKTVCLSFYY